MWLVIAEDTNQVGVMVLDRVRFVSTGTGVGGDCPNSYQEKQCPMWMVFGGMSSRLLESVQMYVFTVCNMLVY